MSASQQLLLLSSGGGGGGDPYASNVTGLFNFVGSNGSTTFTDASPRAINLINGGSPNDTITTGQAGPFSSSCLDSTATGDYIYSGSAHSSTILGAADFTVELWLHPTLSGDHGVIKVSDGAPGSAAGVMYAYIEIDNGGSTKNLRFILQNDAGTSLLDLTSSNNAIAAGSWQHIAVVADGSTGRIYSGGVQVGSGAISGSRTAANAKYIQVGRLQGNSPQRYYTGYVGPTRVTASVCRYPNGTTFTPPTADF